MKRFSFTNFFATAFLCFALALPNAVFAFDYQQLKKDIQNTIKDKGEIKLADFDLFKVAPAGQIVVKEAEYLVSPKNKDLIFITGRGKLPIEFEQLKGKDGDILISILPDVANVRDQKSIFGTISVYFDASGIGDFYKKMDKGILQELLSGKSIFTHSNSTQTLTADMMPKEAAKFFQRVLGKDFVLSLQDGFTLTTTLNLQPKGSKTKAVREFAKKVKLDKLDLVSTVFLCPDYTQIFVKVALGDGFKPSFMPKSFKSAVPYFFVGVSEIGLGMELNLDLPPNKDSMQGICQVSLPILKGVPSSKPAGTPEAEVLAAAAATAAEAFKSGEMKEPNKGSAVLLASLRGLWQNAFNIKNFDIYDLVLKGEVPLKAGDLVIGLGGRVDIGDIKLAIAGKIPTKYNIIETAMMGKASKIPFGNLLDLLLKCTGDKAKSVNIPVEKLHLEDVVFSVAAKDDRDLAINAGLTFAGRLFYGKTLLGFAKVRTTHPKQKELIPITGFMAQCWIKEIKAGPILTITGYGPDGKKGTKDDGVFMDMYMGLVNSHLTFTGKMEFLPQFTNRAEELQLSITPTTFDGLYKTTYFDIYKATFKLKGAANFKKPEFDLHIKMSENFSDDAVKFATELFEDAVANLDEAINEVGDDLKEARADLKEAEEEANKGIDEFKKQVKKISDKISRAKDKIKTYNKKIKAKEKAKDKLKWHQMTKKASLNTQITYLKSLKASKKFAIEQLEKLMSEKNLDKAAKSLKDVAKKALEAAQNTLKATSEKYDNLQEVAKKTSDFAKDVKNFGKKFKIEEIGYRASLKDAKKDKSPKFYAKAIINGKKVDAVFQIDFSDQKKTLLNITKALLKQASEKGNKLGKAAMIFLENFGEKIKK